MKCPNCKKDIPDTYIASYMGKKGGLKSRRTLTTEQARELAYRRHRKNGNAVSGSV